MFTGMHRHSLEVVEWRRTIRVAETASDVAAVQQAEIR